MEWNVTNTYLFAGFVSSLVLILFYFIFRKELAR